MLDQYDEFAFKRVEFVRADFNETDFGSFNEASPLKACMETIESTSIESLKAQNTALLIEVEGIKQIEMEEGVNCKVAGLTEDEKQQIQNETGWSREIIDAIGSMKEYEVYKNAGLQEAEISGKKCLVRSDIDWRQKDSMGRTNEQRAKEGLSPINKDGNTIELHHVGQKHNAPLAELTSEEHRGKENSSVLHDTKKESEIDRVAFSTERSDHWKARSNTGVCNA